MSPPPELDLDDGAEARGPRPAVVPYDLMAICVAAICMAIMIGVGAGVVWLRLFETA